MNITYGKQGERTMAVRKGSNYSSLQILWVNGNEGILHHNFTLWYPTVILRSNFYGSFFWTPIMINEQVNQWTPSEV